MQVCHAKVVGAELGSMTVSFVPRAIKAGSYECDIGSAGSTTLVFQTLLPALLQVWQLGTCNVFLELPSFATPELFSIEVSLQCTIVLYYCRQMVPARLHLRVVRTMARHQA